MIAFRKITPEMDVEMRKLKDMGVKQKVIAKKFNLSEPLVSMFFNGKRY